MNQAEPLDAPASRTTMVSQKYSSAIAAGTLWGTGGKMLDQKA